MNARQWSRDLAMGVRFAFAGGREGWFRATLTAIGVGLGVALLLLTTAIPNALAVRHQRDVARADYTYVFGHPMKAGEKTFVVADIDTPYRGADIRGRMIQREGAQAPVPPGLTKYPAPGEMAVSPALKRLLGSSDGTLLRARLPYRITATIAESGLTGSQELAYYAGSDNLAAHIDPPNVARIDHFGSPRSPDSESDPVLTLLVLVVFVILLMPVGVFVAAAVRFGGERRDRRLAALRLVGSDGWMVRRIAAGEAMAGALLGLVLGVGFFLIGRQLAGTAEVFGTSVFPSYLNPSPVLAALVAVLVPAAAVLVTLFTLRGVVIEPLGVVRTAKPARRRLWWRLLLPVAGLAALYPMIGQGRGGGNFNQYLVTGGVLLLLVGVTALLPWVVETVVGRLGEGAVAWQLAVRRLQLSSGTAARMVNGIAVAVAGAIALQMVFAGVEADYTKRTTNDLTRAQMSVQVPDGVQVPDVAKAMTATKGVLKVVSIADGQAGDKDKDPSQTASVSVGSCASLREIATLPSCHDGDAFALKGSDSETDSETAKLLTAAEKHGRTLYLNPAYVGDIHHGALSRWTVPTGLKQAESRKDPTGYERGGFLLTPGALPRGASTAVQGVVYLSIDSGVRDATEYVINTAVRIDPLMQPETLTSVERDGQFESIRTGLFVGAAAVLALIGASLLVSQLEQLRERKKLLSALVAFGTRRRTLSLSVLWQTAIPIGLGLLLAGVVGLTLGTVLLKMVGSTVRVDWPGVLAMTGFGAAVVLAVTLLSLPPLLRLMRPEGLRTE
ncbi:FtsX-like permease family protein [Streptomyces sp. Ag109_O5-1]|uniref:ABC transporter permease n=1 Tax=Streptomyces sp. Ag109_O5-1 TaxID=1938851 RepID=UPI000F515CB3|nr:FtsX-like permease family protein [Streptomyces sp. Ag109_O5-1]RPE41081.1 FtsX-like permease family protein [Streptomyces sp. Ag109_O5-1]